MRKLILVLILGFFLNGCSTNTVNKSSLITSVANDKVLLSFYRIKSLDLIGTRHVIQIDGKTVAKLQVGAASQVLVTPGQHEMYVYNEGNSLFGAFSKKTTLNFEAGKKYYFSVGPSKDGSGSSKMGPSFSKIPENVWLNYLSQ